MAREIIASGEFGKESFESFDKKLGNSKLQSRFEKEEEERQCRDIERKKQRRLQKEGREEFLSKLDKVVTHEGFE